jgi:hypothetical protein
VVGSGERRWNLDPEPQIFVSDYACFMNNPLSIIDHNGDKPLPKLNSTESRHARRYMRLEKRMSEKTGMQIGSDDIRTAMNQTYGGEKWYWTKGKKIGSTNRYEFTSASELVKYSRHTPMPDNIDDAAINNQTVSIPIGNMNSQQDPNNPAQFIFSMPIQQSGTAQFEATFSNSSQTVNIGLFQDALEFGTTNNLINATLTTANPRSAIVNGNITAGNFLTITRNVNSPTGASMNYNLVVSANMVQRNWFNQRRASDPKLPASHSIVSSHDSRRNRENLSILYRQINR